MTKARIKEEAIGLFFKLNGLFAIFILLGIFMMLVYYGAQTFVEVSFGQFFLSVDWNPSAFGEATYGIISLAASTMMVSIGAMGIAVPLGVLSAAYISEIAGRRTREILKPAIEILAGIPSVVIGFFGIVWLGPLIARMTGMTSGLNAMNGSVLLAIMALPTIISISEDAIRSVPRDYKEASYALGVNRWKTLIHVTIPAAFSGIVAAIMLGLGRAIGETMTVLMATGNAIRMPGSFFDSVRTMTANIAIELGETPYNTTHYFALFAVGLVLFLMSLVVNMTAEYVTKKYKK